MFEASEYECEEPDYESSALAFTENSLARSFNSPFGLGRDEIESREAFFRILTNEWVHHTEGTIVAYKAIQTSATRHPAIFATQESKQYFHTVRT